jgi:hypothetical protein
MQSNAIQVGGRVRLRGESKTDRPWTVEKAGDKYYTLITDDKQGLHPGEDVRVVTAEDIITGMPAHGYAQGYAQQMQMQPQYAASLMNAQGYAQGPPQQPNINIRVVQGDDKSVNTDAPNTGHVPVMTGSMDDHVTPPTKLEGLKGPIVINKV